MTVETRPFGEVIEYIRGVTFAPEDVVAPSAPGAVACMRTKNIQESLDIDDLIAVPEAIVRRKELLLRTGDMLISSANSWELVGKACTVPPLGFAATAGGFIAILRSKGGLDPGYMAHWVKSPATQHRIRRCARKTTNIANLSVPQLEALDVPVPSMPEQRRIADMLDKAEAIRRKRKAAIALADDLLRSTFLDMFGDPIANPRDWPVMLLGGTFAEPPRIGTLVSASEKTGVAVVRVGELGGHGVPIERCGRAPLSERELERFRLNEGDVVLARAIGSEDHLGKAAVVQRLDEVAAFDSHVMRLRFRTEAIEPIFFVQWLRSAGGRARFMREAGRTAVQYNVNGEQMARVQIPLPPLPLQRRFVDLFAAIRRRGRLCEMAMRAGEELFRSISGVAFAAKSDDGGVTC